MQKLIVLSIIFVGIFFPKATNKEIDQLLRAHLTKICETPIITELHADSLLKLFQLNTFSKKKFPNSEGDDSIFYCSVNKMKILATRNNKVLSNIIEVRFLIFDYTEWSEYFTEIISNLATLNTSGFLENYNVLETKKRQIILSDLYWLKEINKDELLFQKFQELESNTYSAEILEIRSYLSSK